MNIKNWSTTASNNNATSPDGFPEGMAPSGVNDSAREMMAALRTQHENAEWIDYGYTLSYISASSFVLDGDRTTQFHAGRRVKAGVGAGNVFGTILSASYSTKTGVTISLDSGNLDSSLSSMAVGIQSYANTSMPQARTASIAQTISDGTNTIRTKIVEIGNWNMVSTTAVSVAHGINGLKIRSADVIIQDDAETTYSPLYYYDGTNIGGRWYASATNIVMTRISNGTFNSVLYDSPSVNRGWIKINYVD